MKEISPLILSPVVELDEPADVLLDDDPHPASAEDSTNVEIATAINLFITIYGSPFIFR